MARTQESTTRFALGVAILAAGRSSRMGSPKLLLRWGDGTVLEHLTRTWRSLAAQVAVVISGTDPNIKRELARLEIGEASQILNPDPDEGMFSSVRCAAKWSGWNPCLTHYAIVLGDQPHVRAATLREFIDYCSKQHESGSVFQPEYRGKPRHPVVFDRAAFEELARSSAPTLRHHLQGTGIRLCPVDDPGLELDLDCPEDYERALRLRPR